MDTHNNTTAYFADTETRPGWEKLVIKEWHAAHKHLDPRPGRLMILTPTYITTNP